MKHEFEKYAHRQGDYEYYKDYEDECTDIIKTPYPLSNKSYNMIFSRCMLVSDYRRRKEHKENYKKYFNIYGSVGYNPNVKY